MSGILKGKFQIVDSTKQWIFITIDLLDGDANLPFTTAISNNLTGVALQNYIDLYEDMYKLIVLRVMYPDNRNAHLAEVGDTELDKFNTWIVNGRNVPAVIVDEVEIEPAKVITKVPWSYVHPIPLPSKNEPLNRGSITDDSINTALTAGNILQIRAAFMRILKGDSFTVKTPVAGIYTFNSGTGVFDFVSD